MSHQRWGAALGKQTVPFTRDQREQLEELVSGGVPSAGVATVESDTPRIVMGGSPSARTIASPSLDQLHANDLQGFSPLADADITLSLAGGRRYRLPDGVLTVPRTATLSSAGATAGDVVTFLAEQRGSTTLAAHYSLIVKDGVSNATILDVRGKGAFIAEFDGTNWKGKTPAGLQVFNVKDYGASGDERVGVYAPQAESQAIQAAIDAAAKAGRDPSFHGAVIYFPPGVYRIDGYPLVMRRTLYGSPLTYMGGGSSASLIMNSTGVGSAGDAFHAESLSENTAVDHGGELHTFIDLSIAAKHYALIWDHGDGVISGFNDGVRFGPRFHRCHFSRTTTPGPMVRLSSPSRAKFFDCVFDASVTCPGVIGLEVVRGSASLYGCKGGGALVRYRDAGEVSLIGCRCEGAQAIPGWDFLNVLNLHIENSTNEGNDEADAVYRFQDCSWITTDNVFPATPDRSYVTITKLVAVSGAPTVTFSNTPAGGGAVVQNRIVRSAGSWFQDNIGYGAKVKITNAVTNTAWYTVMEATHDTLWVAETLSAESVVGATGSGTFPIGLFIPSDLPNITFSAGAQSIGRADGSWTVDGFTVGMTITTTATLNPGPFTVATISGDGLTMTVNSGIVNEGPVKKRVHGDKFPAGLTFRNCKAMQIRNTISQNRFADLGTQTRFGIEVDANCRDGWFENSHAGNDTDISIAAGAYNCTGQSHGYNPNPANQRTWWHGRHRMVGLDVEEDLLHLRKEKTTAPSGLCGLTVHRDANGFRSVVYQDTSPAGWHFAQLNSDESTFGGYDDAFAQRFVGPSSAAAKVVARSGQAVQLAGTSATLGDTVLLSVFPSGAECRIDSIDHMHFKTPTGKYMLLESAAEFSVLSTDTSLYGGGNLGVRVVGGSTTVYGGAGAARVQCNATGIGLNGSTPVAKATITGSRSDGSALASLLTYLASRGDIIDSSTA